MAGSEDVDQQLYKKISTMIPKEVNKNESKPDPYSKRLTQAEKEFNKKYRLAVAMRHRPTNDEWAPLTTKDEEFRKSSNKILRSLDKLYTKF